MKVYSISKWTFLGISLLILVLPVSRHWRLMLKGKKAQGTVVAYNRLWQEHIGGEVTIAYASEIEFLAGEEPCRAYGPLNYEYRPGRSLRVLYDPSDPSRYCVLTFSGFYLNHYSALPMILLVLWGAFYLSFNTLTKKFR